MKIEKIIKKNSNQYKIILSDKTSLSFYDDVIIKYSLLINKEITSKEIIEITNENNLYAAYYEGLKLIKIKLRTKKELKDLLVRKNYSLKAINFAIEKLSSQGYLNEELYIKCYINDAYNLKYLGPNRIIYELKKLGLNEEKINQELNSFKDKWQENIKKLVNKEIKINHTSSSKVLKEKIIRKLITKGYYKEDINNCLEKIVIDDSKVLEKEFNKELNKLSKKYLDNELKYMLKKKLYQKGFNLNDINKLIN